MDYQQKTTFDKLPAEFDVFCTGAIDNDGRQDLVVPGRLYVAGYVDVGHLTVSEDLIVDGDISCGDLNVGGDCFTDLYVDCLEVHVEGHFHCFDINSNKQPIFAEEITCDCYEDMDDLDEAV